MEPPPAQAGHVCVCGGEWRPRSSSSSSSPGQTGTDQRLPGQGLLSMLVSVPSLPDSSPQLEGCTPSDETGNTRSLPCCPSPTPGPALGPGCQARVATDPSLQLLQGHSQGSFPGGAWGAEGDSKDCLIRLPPAGKAFKEPTPVFLTPGGVSFKDCLPASSGQRALGGARACLELNGAVSVLLFIYIPLPIS